MKNLENDILADKKSLKEMPYSVPADYFDGLRQELKKVQAPSQASDSGVIRRFSPHLAFAAMLALLVTAGGFLFERFSGDNFIEEDYIVFSDELPSTIFYEETEQYADATTEDDFIEYLIHTGVELEDLETY